MTAEASKAMRAFVRKLSPDDLEQLLMLAREGAQMYVGSMLGWPDDDVQDRVDEMRALIARLDRVVPI